MTDPTSTRPPAPCPIDDLAALREGRRPLIGLDPGTKTIGVAVSDTGWSIASPIEVIRRKKFTLDAARLAEIIAERDACAIVIGLPVNMDGSEGPRAQSVRAFMRNLAQKTDLPQAFWDERWSTAAVTRTLLDADVSRARRKDLVDKMAAAYILQGALDYFARKN